MAEPHRCPICNGTGKVAAEFYGINYPDYPNIERVSCRSCQGTGIVWDYSITYTPPPYKPIYDPYWTGPTCDPPYWLLWTVSSGDTTLKC